MINILMILFLIAGLSILIFIMNQYILKNFKENKTKNALILVYVTMITSFFIVMLIAFCLRTILFDITNIFYRS